MTVFHALQCALALVLVALLARKAREVLFEAPVETGPYLRSLTGALVRGDRAMAERLSLAAGWVPRIAAVLLRTRGEDDGVEVALAEFRDRATHDLRVLRVGASMASACGLLGALLELQAMMRAAGEGGSTEGSLARALLTMTIGFATGLGTLTCARLLSQRAAALVADTRRAADEIERALARTSDGAGPPAG